MTTPVSSPTSTPPASSAQSLSSATADEQQDRFMKLLVAQMKNQDPLNPMDNAEMTSQIAQINTVGGIEKLNRTVESLLNSFTAMQASNTAAQLPGKDVLVAGTSLTLVNGKGAEGGVQLAANADTVNVEILDAGGAVVRSLPMGKNDAGVRAFSWDGLRADGTAAAEGSYKIRVTATAGGKTVEAIALTSATVESVSGGADGMRVDLGAAGVRNYGDIKAFL